MKKSINKLFLMSLFVSQAILAQQQEIKIWEEIPGRIDDDNYTQEKQYDDGGIRGYSKVSEPTLTIFKPAEGKATGAAVVICPGGGYSHLAINKEGYKLGQWFAEHGITGFVLKYRLPSDAIMEDKTIGPLQDAQRAIRLVRERAKEFGVKEDQVGIMGFSAGGHLASTASTHFEDVVYEGAGNISARPDFSILVYPVISLQNGVTHQGSRQNLLGKNAKQDAVYQYSGEYQVTPQTPKTLLIHATDDGAVPVENSIRYYMALKNAGVPVEMHVYEDGGHGFGMGTSTTEDSWPDAMALWLKKHNLIAQ